MHSNNDRGTLPEMARASEEQPAQEQGAQEKGSERAALSFEASTERLKLIVQQLESGELSLEKSLSLFEEGVRVARAAQARLDEAERRVEELLGVNESGALETRELD